MSGVIDCTGVTVAVGLGLGVGEDDAVATVIVGGFIAVGLAEGEGVAAAGKKREHASSRMAKADAIPIEVTARRNSLRVR